MAKVVSPTSLLPTTTSDQTAAVDVVVNSSTRCNAKASSSATAPSTSTNTTSQQEAAVAVAAVAVAAVVVADACDQLELNMKNENNVAGSCSTFENTNEHAKKERLLKEYISETAGADFAAFKQHAQTLDENPPNADLSVHNNVDKNEGGGAAEEKGCSSAVLEGTATTESSAATDTEEQHQAKNDGNEGPAPIDQSTPTSDPNQSTSSGKNRFVSPKDFELLKVIGKSNRKR